MIRLPHLETDVSYACENACASCNHASPYRVGPRPSMIRPEDVERDLWYFTKVATADAYAMIGGEPTLNPWLVEILDAARRSGVAPMLEVWTHGQSLKRMRPSFWTAFDRLVVSIYPGKHDDESIAWIETKCREEEVELVLKDERRYPNFSRLLEPRPTDEAATLAKWKACWFRGFSRVLDRGFFWTCCTSPHLSTRILGLPNGADGIAVEGLTEERLLAFLESPTPLKSCAICCGRNTESSIPVPWQEVRDPQEWLRASGMELQ